MRHLLTIILILTCLCEKSHAQVPGISSVGNGPKTTLTSKLGIPFGTIAKLQAEIYDGENLQDKGDQSTYLLKINSVNGKIIKGTLLLRFTDETRTLANNPWSLYELIYKKEANSLSDDQINKMKKKYVGKKLTLMAYETGQFTGIPKDYGKYRPLPQSLGFVFQHHLMVVSNLKK